MQLEHKLSRARHALGPWLGEVQIEVAAPPATPHHDRIKLLYPAAPDAHGVLQMGLYAGGSHELIAIEECAVQARALTLLGQRVANTLRRFGLTAYREADRSGTVRALQARIMPGTGELLVGLVTAREMQWSPDLIAALCATTRTLPRATRANIQLVGLVHNLNDAPGNVLLGPRTQAIWGRDHQYDRSDHLTFRVSFNSFYQVHRHAAALLYRPALAMLGPVQGARVIDGYGGVGTFALRLAQAGADIVHLVESNPWACADAEASAQSAGLSQKVQVHVSAFGAALDVDRADVMVIDPPRAGLGEAGVREVLRLAPDRLLYVSCSVESLARDLAQLCPTFVVRAARLADLFPHTEHCESLLLLTRNR